MLDNHASEWVPVVNEAVLLTLTYDDRTVLRELIQMFLEDAPGQLEELRVAIARCDCSVLEQRAHAFRGAAAGMTGARVAAVAARLEAAGQAGDLTGSENDYRLLTVEMARLGEALLRMAERHGG